MRDASADLTARLTAAQDCLTMLAEEARAEGLDCEIYTVVDDDQTAYRICLVRRIYAPRTLGPALKVID